MKSNTHRPPCLLLALFLAVCGCGSTVDTGYPGEPLVTLEGQMTLAPGISISGPVRLALIWYPGWAFGLDLGAHRPDSKAVVAEDIPYEGSFPANFRFHVYRPPPDEARSGQGEGSTFASGILIAYQDKNGNGKLDTIPATGSPVDRLLGSTVVFTESRFHYLLYTDMEFTFVDGVDLKKGFNLVRFAGLMDSATLPLSTPISLELSASPILDMMVCEPLWSSEEPQVEGNLCGIPGLDDSHPDPDALQVQVTVNRSGEGAQVSLTLATGEDAEVLDAQVTLGGEPVPYDIELGAYSLPVSSAAPLLEGGTIELTVTWGGKELKRTLSIPGRFDITSPVPDAVAPGGSKFEVRWTRPTGADAYNVYLIAGFDFRSAELLPPDQLAYVFYSVSHDGPASLRVEAVTGTSENASELKVFIKVVREVFFTLQP